jgi:hypothetical protein
MVGPRPGGSAGRGIDAWASAADAAQPWLARAFFLRFASLRFRFTDGFS